MIAIINYGLGNVQAFINIYKRLHIPAKIANSPDDLHGATKLILPGVGAFDHAMRQFDNSGLRPAVEQLVLVQKTPILGVCVGMQMLAEQSDEGVMSGLGWLNGRVCSLSQLIDNSVLPLPHMGWNDISCVDMANGLFKNLENGAKFYFLHSYYFECGTPEHSTAITDYGKEFCCAVRKDNIYGTQFHPEKSHHFGLQLLKNFSEIGLAC